MATTTRLLSAAIDIGTTYSGYAFSLKHEKYKITTNKLWKDSDEERVTYKNPTIVLLNSKGQFHSFGYQAETKYAALVSEGNHKSWYYFKLFKMSLYKNKNLNRSLMIPDSTLKKKFNAMEVFAMAIRYLKDHMLDLVLKQYGQTVKESDIQIVLTVPAIWDESAKQFMRESAIKAGIGKDHITVSLEPETASIYCRSLTGKALGDTEGNVDIDSTGARYMVIDAGGGTVDIAVHQVEPGNKLRELFSANGGDWGGAKVDDLFCNDFLIKVFGQGVMMNLRRDHRDDWLDMERSFEMQKRRVSVKTGKDLTMNIPASLIELYEETGRTFDDLGFGKAVSFLGNKLKVSSDKMISFFTPVCDEIVKHVSGLFQSPSCANVKTILMVGGFSESPLLRERIAAALPKCRIIVPEDASLAVLKGAVIFGHEPETINVRLSAYTYGIDILGNFDPSKHDQAHCLETGGVKWCQDMFDPFLEMDKPVTLGQMSERKVYHPSEIGQTEMSLPVFRSTEKSPTYSTDPSCTHVGEMIVPMPDLRGEKKREVWVNVVYGGTELTVKAHDVTTGKDHDAKFDFLSK